MKSHTGKILLTGVLLASITGCSLLQNILDGDWTSLAREVTTYVYQSALDSLAAGEVAEEYEPSQEYYIGRGVSAAVVDAYTPADPADETNRSRIIYLNELGGYLRESTLEVTRDARELGGYVRRNDEAVARIENLRLFRGLHVGLLDVDEVCAFATPGGFIWISRGAIELCETEDELAAIICHELAHVVLNHGMDAYRRANENRIADSPWVRNALGDDDSVFAQFGRLVTSFADDLITSGYSREQEFEADNWGTRALAEAGYDPNAMVRMLEGVREYERARGGGRGTYLDNHPDIDARVKAVQDLIRAENLRAAGDPGRGQADRNTRFLEMFPPAQ
jgi:beta-barrel assembly-enhancing protease